MSIPIYQVDAFADRVFSGNPAAVCPLERWLDDATLQAIAAENNLSETAFLVRRNGGWDLRWFTPATEVDLCGHATLASAYVVFRYLDATAGSVSFATRSGVLGVEREGERLVLDFPADPPRPIEAPAGFHEALRAAPREVGRARYLMAVFDDEDQVAALAPSMERVAALDALGVIATAKGREHDFVSRFFAPRAGVPEDPVTGSAHCILTPYWAERLGATRLRARQISPRGGDLECELRGDRVRMAGRAVLYLEGRIAL